MVVSMFGNSRILFVKKRQRAEDDVFIICQRDLGSARVPP